MLRLAVPAEGAMNVRVHDFGVCVVFFRDGTCPVSVRKSKSDAKSAKSHLAGPHRVRKISAASGDFVKLMITP
jgi:hypothetical protein